MKKLAYLLLVLPLFLFNACTDDIPSSLTGTEWTLSLTAQEAWDMMGEQEDLPTGADISFAITLNFTSSTSVKIDSNASVTVNGKTETFSDSEVSTYTYDSETGKVSLKVGDETEIGTVEKKTLTFVSDGKTMIFTKK